jgi:tRNA/tmRNA/rRNA uracil-C5-methylase (TrmA/RlmC/RlmD family)
VVAVEAARRGAEVLATDFAPGMVEVMRRNFAAEGLDTRAEVMDGLALDLEDEARADRRGSASLTEPPVRGLASRRAAEHRGCQQIAQPRCGSFRLHAVPFPDGAATLSLARLICA